MFQQLLRRPITDPDAAASFLRWHWGHPHGDFDYEVTINEELGAVAALDQGGSGNATLSLMSIEYFMELANEEFASEKNVFEPESWHELLGYEWSHNHKPTENQTLIEFIKYFTTPGATASRIAQGPPSLSPRMPKVMDPKKAELLWEFEYMVQHEGSADAFHIIYDEGLSAVAWVWGYDDYFSPELEHINELMTQADEYLRKHMTVEAVRENKRYWGKLLLEHSIDLPDLKTPAWRSHQPERETYFQQLEMYPEVEMRTHLAQYFAS